MGDAPLDTPDNTHKNLITPGILCQCHTMKDEVGNYVQSPEHIVTTLLPSVPVVGSKLVVRMASNETAAFVVCDVVFITNDPSVKLFLQRTKHPVN